MSSVTDSEDTELVLTTTIFPDWAQTVVHRTSWSTTTFVATSGLEQRSAKSSRPRKTMELSIDAMTRAQSQDIMSVLENRGAGPLLVPWFPEGLRVSTTMGGANSVQVEVAPLDDWMPQGAKILVGNQVRTVASVSNRTFTLEALTGATLWPAGTWVYPMRLAAIDRPEDSASIIRFDAARQSLRFVQLET
jgi:hypothetical protein